MPAAEPALHLALRLAASGWHLFPLDPTRKAPLANCRACHTETGRAPHMIDQCPCLSEGRWCHGVRAATRDPDRLTVWFARRPRAAIGAAAGPSGLLLIDIDTHASAPPDRPATQLLPGIDLTAEPVDPALWNHRRYHDGRDSLRLLAHLRGGRRPWPADPEHAPVAADTPSGGRHLWYRAPPRALHQAIGALAWQVDVKAGWSYGLAPDTTTTRGRYHHRSGDLGSPGSLPPWLEREVARVAGNLAAPALHGITPRTQQRQTSRSAAPAGRAAYIDAILRRGATRLSTLADGRKQELAALAYKIGGYLDWAGQSQSDVLGHLIDAGINAGLSHAVAERTARRSLANGLTHPLAPHQLKEDRDDAPRAGWPR
jgi:hypothetical protein